MFVGSLRLPTDTDNTSTDPMTLSCLELKEICSVFKVSRCWYVGSLGRVHNNGQRKSPAADNCVSWNAVQGSHGARRPRAHAEKSAAVHANPGSSVINLLWDLLQSA